MLRVAKVVAKANNYILPVHQKNKIKAASLPRQNVKLKIYLGHYFVNTFASEFQWLKYHFTFGESNLYYNVEKYGKISAIYFKLKF